MYLKLRWARFFTLAGWGWKLSSRPGFDFEVTFPCGHGDCPATHSVLVRVCEKTHKALERKHADLYSIDQMYAVPHPALFGDGPQNTHWQMAHGCGGGDETAENWTKFDANELWERAAHD